MALFDRLLRRTPVASQATEDLAAPPDEPAAAGSFFSGKLLSADDLKGEQSTAAASGWPAKWELSDLDASTHAGSSSVLADLAPGELTATADAEGVAVGEMLDIEPDIDGDELLDF